MVGRGGRRCVSVFEKLWKLIHAHTVVGVPPACDPAELDSTQRTLRRQIHETIAKVTDDVGRRYTFNTAIAATMELLNNLTRYGDDSEHGRAVMHEGLEAIVLMLSPIVPHVTHSLWAALGHAGAIIDAPWPTCDKSALVRDTIDLVVQVKGRKRGEIAVEANADRETIERTALANANVARFLQGAAIKKIIVVPGRLVNIVI